MLYFLLAYAILVTLYAVIITLTLVRFLRATDELKRRLKHAMHMVDNGEHPNYVPRESEQGAPR